MPLKIAQVATADCSIRILLLDHIRSLQEQGHQVTAVCAPGLWTSELRRAGVDIYAVDMARELHPLADVKSLARLYRFFRRRRFDIVHTHTPKAGLIGPLAARLAGVPLVVHTVHGFLFHERMPWPSRYAAWLAEKWTASWADCLLFQSREDYQNAPRLHILDSERCFYAGNGVDVHRFRRSFSPEKRAYRRAALGLGTTNYVIGYVGRLVREKGVLDLFHAFGDISRVYPEAKLLVIGGLETNSQKDSLTERDLDHWRHRMPVVFAGYRSDVEDLYPLLDLFVLPSYREGLPRALVEACIAGVPVIATRIRGNREVVEDGVTGLLYTPGSVAELAQALESSIVNRAAAQRRAAAAQAFAVTRFDEKLVFNRVAEAYGTFFQLARRKSRPAAARLDQPPDAL